MRKPDEILQSGARSEIPRDLFNSEGSEGSKKRTKRGRVKTPASFRTVCLIYACARIGNRKFASVLQCTTFTYSGEGQCAGGNPEAAEGARCVYPGSRTFARRNDMKKRFLRDIEVSAVGLGCMGFSHGYGAGPVRDEAIR